METKEVKATSTLVNVKMKSSVELEGVVVTALGIKSKKRTYLSNSTSDETLMVVVLLA
jgi:hypothetical protein